MEEHLKPLALSPENLVKVLVRSGCRIMTMELLQRDIDAGMPVNADGTVNLINYMAWMIKEVNGDGNESEPAQAD
ncbi:MAG: hypothetical protein BWY31_04277 [Lentisphaerae bacterium ADurb.Bin242]|nr:MAG: hypothetical protein BWY31_04277 [Lentisphaerae bacterium ADurb.Bin242]